MWKSKMKTESTQYATFYGRNELVNIFVYFFTFSKNNGKINQKLIKVIANGMKGTSWVERVQEWKLGLIWMLMVYSLEPFKRLIWLWSKMRWKIKKQQPLKWKTSEPNYIMFGPWSHKELFLVSLNPCILTVYIISALYPRKRSASKES